jgi:hypothetical protein
MVWQSVKLVLPLEMKAYRAAAVTLANMPDAAAELDMRVASKRPACNIAVAESPMGAFRQSSLTINGRIFSEVNDYRRVLDACYRGTGPSSYGDNHSLKPIVCRDIHAPVSDQYNVQQSDGANPPVYTPFLNAGGNAVVVKIEDHNARTIDSAFSLLEHNGPFIERARKFQDELSYDGKTWRGLITNYLELGPFQARARVSNTAVPYVRDLHLRLNFDTNPSRFDARMGTEMTGLPLSSCRTIPCKLFEFGTVPNILHLGESIRRTADFICGMQLKYTEKPYLEVQYVRYIEPMKSFYNLRCFEHQYEQSNPFQLIAPQASLVSPTSLQRVTSRLLSYPTKIYLYASLSDTEQNPYIMGNVRRSCLLENIHCRVNQRADIIFNPSQEECYQMFRRHTNSSLEYGAWLKSPIYCFDPVDLGQPDFLANDARLSLMEWDASVSLTALQIQEQDEALKMNSIESMGYKSDFTSSESIGVTSATGNLVEASWDNNAPNQLANAAVEYNICMDVMMGPAATTTGITIAADAQLMVGRTYQFSDVKYLGVRYPPTTSEMIKIKDATATGTRFKGMIWAQVQTAAGQGQVRWSVIGDRLYWVPESYLLDRLPANADVINQYSELTTTIVNPGAAATYTYVVTAGCKFIDGARIRKNADPLDGREINPSANFNARGYQITPGPFAYVTDAHGIRNQNANNNAVYATPGLNPPGAAFTRADQRVNANVKWACFRPTQAMWNGGGDPDQMVIRWRGANAPEHQAVGTTTPLFSGHCGLYIRGGMERDQGVPNKAINNAVMNWDTQTGVSWPLHDITFKDYADPEFDYTLKALYEYGNCQYQFTADGAPTKVLPNLVPVRDSSAIPIV